MILSRKKTAVLGFLLTSAVAFSPTAFLSRSSSSYRTRSPFRLDSSPKTTADDWMTEQFLNDEFDCNKLPSNSRYHLELDSRGSLRFRNEVLIKGLDLSIWSATRPSSGEENCLFLHTSHMQEESEYLTSLGDLISCRRLIACSRLTRYWMGPKVGESAKDVPFDTQFLLVEMKENQEYAIMLPMVDNGFRASLHAGDGDTRLDVVCAAESGDAAVTSNGMRALYVAVGTDPFDLIKKGFADVAQATGTFRTLDEKELPPSVNDFGWCTWDAFYSKVTPEGIVEGVEALRKAGVPPRKVILDDGWQQVSPSPPDWKTSSVGKAVDESKSVINWLFDAIGNIVMGQVVKLVCFFYEQFVRRAHHDSLAFHIFRFLSKNILKSGLWRFFDSETDFNRQLSGFEANYKFNDKSGEKTLKDLVFKLKEQLGVRSVYCWHALHGYWRGVSEELGRNAGINVTNVHPQPSQSILKLQPESAWDPVSLFGVGIMSTESDLKRFYELIHTPLVEAGIDGVKVDVQSGVSSAGDGDGGGPHLAELYTRAMEDSVIKRFPASNGAANCINCMCHSTENLYRYETTSVARASEDFFPDRPETHTVHLVNVAYNSLFLGEICLPDWDMFHSRHDSAELHAAARSIGGCPVYVSDQPGQHDPELLKKLVIEDGSILRAQQPGRPTKDCLFVDVTSDGTSALKIWNKNSYGGVVGAFNVQGVAWNFVTNENEVLESSPPRLLAKVKPYDIDTLRDIPGPFVAWRHRSQSMEFIPDGNTVLQAHLDHREWELFTIVPIQIHDNLMWAPLGLSGMMNTGGALTSVEKAFNGKQARFRSRGPGPFVAFANASPSRVGILDNSAEEATVTDLAFSHDGTTGVLSFTLPSERSDRSPHDVIVEWE